MYKLAFIIPHFNHSQKLPLLVGELRKFGHEILIIDDGSDKAHKNKLENLGVNVIYRQNNGGKGAALKDGFIYLEQNGFTHALQIDADMQHELSNLHDFIKLSENNPDTLICGAPIYSSDAPRSRLYGRKITNFWVAVNTLNLTIKDAMCGFRVYPIKQTCEILPKCKSNGMDYDIDILYLLFKAGVKFLWLDVNVRYEVGGVSHFKGFKDNLLISKIHAKHFFDLPRFILKRLLRV
ncbi:MAG: glycosyltransferase family 2 protein [Campylobacter sp.]|nr:glycosyltransferase family 2 protein [Campylobacter sp.]